MLTWHNKLKGCKSMSSEEQVLSDYQANRRKLEDEEALVKRVDRKGQHLIEQAFYDLDVTAR